jgi:uncharacterized damage-inducible protein DinB
MRVLDEGHLAMNLGLVEMLRYNAWASRTLLDACRDLTDEQLEAALVVTPGSVGDLLLHVVGGQQAYINLVQGLSDTSGLDRNRPWPGMAQLLVIADQTSRELISLAEQLDPTSEVDLAHHGKVHRYPKRFLLASAVEHGVRHRTEVTVNLASIGLPMPELDGWAYGRSAGYGAEV